MANTFVTPLRAMLREIVHEQDTGKFDIEPLRMAFGTSLVHSVMAAAHTERLRMIHEGIDVRVPPPGGGAYLGFVPTTAEGEKT